MLNKKNVKEEDIVKFTLKLDEYSKTIKLINGSINQMSSYISPREKIAKSDPEFKKKKLKRICFKRERFYSDIISIMILQSK